MQKLLKLLKIVKKYFKIVRNSFKNDRQNREFLIRPRRPLR